MKYSEEDMVRRAHSAIMRSPNWCWLTQVILLGTWELEDRGGRPYTDGFNINYNTTRIAELAERHGDKGVRYVVTHENLHKALRHLVVWKKLWKENPTKANYAMDVVCNNLIAEYPDFAIVPDDSVHHPEWAGMNTGEVWDALTDAGMDGTDENGDPQGDDDHKEYAGGTGDGDSGTDAGDSGTDAGDSGTPTETEVAALMQAAVSQGMYLQKQKCPETARKLGALVTPKVDWRKALAAWLQQRQWGHERSNWKRRSRRGMALGAPLPSRYEERTGRLVLAIDTSGSIDDKTLNAFLSEVSSLCMPLKPESVELVYWGSYVMLPSETYTQADYPKLISTTKPKDGGGTRILEVRDWLRTPAMKDVTGCVILTDGYVGAWGEGTYPCPMFVVLNTNAPCPMASATI